MRPRGSQLLLAIAGIALLIATVGAGAPTPRSATPGAAPSPVAAPPSTPARPRYLPDSTVLIRFDGEPIRALEVLRAYFMAVPTDVPKYDSLGRVQFVNYMVDQRILGALAQQVNPPMGFADRAQLRNQEQRTLSNALFQREVLDSIVIDSTVMHQIFDHGVSTARHLRLMSFADHPTAERLRAALATRRMNWDQVYRIAQRGPHRANLGDLGWVTPFDLVDQLPATVHTLKPGEYSELWQDVGGWNLVKCVETHDSNPLPFNVMAGRIGMTMQMSQTFERSEALTRQLRTRAGMTYDTTNLIWAAEQFATANAGTRSGEIHLGKQIPNFAPEDTGRVLARMDSRAFSLDDFVHAYGAVPPAARSAVDTPERLRRRLDSIVLEPLRAVVARERGLERDSSVVADLRKKREQILVEHIFHDSVEVHIHVTEAMRQKYFKDNETKFFTYARVQYAAFVTSRRGEADSLAVRLRAGARPESIIAEDQRSGRPRGKISSMSQSQEGADYYALLFEELKPGQVDIQGPDPVGAYMVFQSLAFDAGHQMSFAESADIVDESVQNIEGERLLKALIDRHRSEHRVETHPELVMQVRWKDPTLPR